MKKKYIQAIKKYIGKGGAIAFEHSFSYFCNLNVVKNDKCRIFIITDKDVEIGYNGHCYKFKITELDENDLYQVVKSIKLYITYLKVNQYVSEDMEEITHYLN